MSTVVVVSDRGAGAVAGLPEAVLVVAELRDDTVVFAGDSGDHPQRLRCARQPDGSLLLQVAGIVKGRRPVDEFPCERVACDAPPAESIDQEATS